MKNYSIILLVILLTGCGKVAENVGTPGVTASPEMTYNQALNNCTTILMIRDCILDRVKYTADTLPEHTNQAAEYTYNRRLGDCEDFAILAKEMLTRHGYDAHVMFIFPSIGGNGHAICLIDHGTYYTYFTNGRYANVKRYSLEEVSKEFFSPGYYYFWGE